MNEKQKYQCVLHSRNGQSSRIATTEAYSLKGAFEQFVREHGQYYLVLNVEEVREDNSLLVRQINPNILLITVDGKQFLIGKDADNPGVLTVSSTNNREVFIKAISECSIGIK